MISPKKTFLMSIFSISIISFGASMANAQSFLDPNLSGWKIDACIDSYRFQDSCSGAAKRVVANTFCRHKGYSYALQFKTQDFGWKSRVGNYKWTEKYINGRMQSGFYGSVGANLLTAVECKK